VVAHADSETQGNKIQSESGKKSRPTEKEERRERAGVENGERDDGNPVDSVALNNRGGLRGLGGSR
jgi:hypothetical protein